MPRSQDSTISWTSSRFIPDEHLPLSRCWIRADGERNEPLQFAPMGHSSRLSGLCFKEAQCCCRDCEHENFRLHFVHSVLDEVNRLCSLCFRATFGGSGLRCARLSICATKAWISLKEMSQSQHLNSEACLADLRWSSQDRRSGKCRSQSEQKQCPDAHTPSHNIHIHESDHRVGLKPDDCTSLCICERGSGLELFDALLDRVVTCRFCHRSI
jgi:hypothetical protein